MNPNDVAGALVGSLFFLSIAAVIILRGPLGKAWARRIEGPGAAGAVAPAELEELRSRLDDMEQQVGRVHELEERLDFTERMLAQQREQARLPH
jgi:tetrahydromethanopterin S-methyltransferase subunit G